MNGTGIIPATSSEVQGGRFSLGGLFETAKDAAGSAVEAGKDAATGAVVTEIASALPFHGVLFVAEGGKIVLTNTAKIGGLAVAGLFLYATLRGR